MHQKKSQQIAEASLADIAKIILWGVLGITTMSLGHAAVGIIGVHTGWWVVETDRKAQEGLTPEIEADLRTAVDDAIRDLP